MNDSARIGTFLVKKAVNVGTACGKELFTQREISKVPQRSSEGKFPRETFLNALALHFILTHFIQTHLIQTHFMKP